MNSIIQAMTTILWIYGDKEILMLLKNWSDELPTPGENSE